MFEDQYVMGHIIKTLVSFSDNFTEFFSSYFQLITGLPQINIHVTSIFLVQSLIYFTNSK